MAITSTGLNADYYTDVAETTTVENKTELGKDDFMTLLLVELQNQDPTEPMDTEKILTQTSQLATLESAENTNTSLETLAASLDNSQQFSTVAAIGRVADLGSNAIALDEESSATFEVYFSDGVSSGEIEILDTDGNIVSTIALEESEAGIKQFEWDGILDDGTSADSGVYYVTSSYKNTAGEEQTTRMGLYPIESVRFDSGEVFVKVGSSYVSLENVQEIY